MKTLFAVIYISCFSVSVFAGENDDIDTYFGGNDDVDTLFSQQDGVNNDNRRTKSYDYNEEKYENENSYGNDQDSDYRRACPSCK